MGLRELESREYKVMLDRTRFADPDALPQAASQLWQALIDAAGGGAAPLSSATAEWTEPTRREVTFFDSATARLHHSDFVLRHRADEDGSSKVTLKRRSPDRVLAAHSGVEKHGDRAADYEVKRKFEEDIKLTIDDRMRSMFSNSLDWRNPPGDVDLTVIDTVEAAFPGFRRATRLDGDPLISIGPSPVIEHVLELEGCELAGDPAKVVLVAWYAESIDRPSVVELSYKYEGDERDFEPAVAAAGLAVLHVLGGMSTWRPPMKDRITKTRWIYEESGLLS